MSNPDAIRVALVDDHAIVREGLRRVLERDADLRVVGEASTADEALQLLRATACDVVLLDVSMPDRSGLSLLPELRHTIEGVRVLVLSMHDRPEYIVEAMRAGAAGYALKDVEPQSLREAVRIVAGGGSFFPEPVRERLGDGLRRESASQLLQQRLAMLTPRERDVLVQITRGATNQEIAARLDIGRRTVESHREHLMEKLAIRTVAGLTRFAIDCGLE